MFQASILSIELLLLVTLMTTLSGGLLTWSLRDSSNLLSVLVGTPLVFSSLIYSFVFLSFFDAYGFYGLRSLFGLSLILSLNLTPYMFFSLRLGLKSFGESLEESLALSNISFFKKLMIYSKFLFPFWAVGFGFLSLEILSEFGASFLFGQETLSVFVYNLWLEQYNLAKAVSGFIVLLSFVLILFVLSLYFQKEKDLSSQRRNKESKEKVRCLFPLLYILTGVLFPVGFLTFLSLGSWQTFKVSTLYSSFSLAFCVSAFIFVLFVGLNKGEIFPKKSYLKLPGVFYGVPGVLIGMLFYFLGFKVGFLSLILALSLKYYKFLVDYVFSSWNVISDSSKLSRNLIDTYSKKVYLDFKVSFSFLIISFAMIFIEVLKELPISLMIKPVQMQTLTTEIFSLVSEGDWELAAPYAIIVFVFGFLALIINQVFLNISDNERLS